MATLQPIREYGFTQQEPGLSIHESRCLCVRLTECDALLVQAILGAVEACGKTHAAPGVVTIRRSLERAQVEIAAARALANQVLVS